MQSLTAVIYDTDCYTLANDALERTIAGIKVDEVLIFSDRTDVWGGKKVNVVAPLTKKGEYDNFVVNQLPQYINTTHFLIVQFDGFIINPDEWSNLFWHYDYIGAPWPQHNHGPMNVGNGGFSFRSRRLSELVSTTNYNYFNGNIPEDLYVCQHLRPWLEQQNCFFPHESIASHFSAESYLYRYPTFGFHNIRFLPLVYKDKLDYLLENLSDRVVKTFGDIMLPFMQQVSTTHADKLIDKIKKLK